MPPSRNSWLPAGWLAVTAVHEPAIRDPLGLKAFASAAATTEDDVRVRRNGVALHPS
jgi:hypothetical protein